MLDAHQIPSPISAGNDVNKIMEEGESTRWRLSSMTSLSRVPAHAAKYYKSDTDAGFPSSTDTDEDYVWNRMHQLATNAWRTDPIYRQFYHPTGLVIASSSETAGRQVTASLGKCKYPCRRLSSPDDFQGTMPEGILTGDFPNWKGFIMEKGAGWVFARGALEAAYREASRMGVRFITGEQKGKVEQLLYASTSVLGARTTDGVEHKADRTILCAGANSDRLFDLERQLRPTAWTLAHIQMTEEERRTWRDLPVLFNVERGFFMVPTNPLTHLFRMNMI